MIVPTMNNHEIIKDVAKDLYLVLTKGEYLTENLRRKALKSKDKYANEIFEYISKNNNHWLIFSEYRKKKQIYFPVAYYIDKHGFNALIINKRDENISHLTPHFLARFNQRFLKQPNLSKKEILKIYLEKNFFGCIQYLPDTEEMKNGMFIKNEDGIALGYFENLSGSINRVYRFKTFITDDMIKRNQEDYMNQMTRAYKSYSLEIYNQYKKRTVA